MRRLLSALAAVLSLTGPAIAEDRPVVVELFTSQGCSSCPPADALLGQLASRDDVIALALHVDYWDYLGWADEFADPAFTQRQRLYAKAAKSRTIYTPQMIVGGEDHIVGYKPKELSALIQRHAARPQAVDLSVTREAGVLKIVGVGAMAGKMSVHLVSFDPLRSVDIKRGENAGKRLDYFNVVTGWTVVASWDGSAPLQVEVPAPDSENAVVLVQKAGAGPIMAAARVR